MLSTHFRCSALKNCYYKYDYLNEVVFSVFDNDYQKGNGATPGLFSVIIEKFGRTLLHLQNVILNYNCTFSIAAYMICVNWRGRHSRLRPGWQNICYGREEKPPYFQMDSETKTRWSFYDHLNKLFPFSTVNGFRSDIILFSVFWLSVYRSGEIGKTFRKRDSLSDPWQRGDHVT